MLFQSKDHQLREYFSDVIPLKLLLLLRSLHKNLILSFLSHYFLILVQDDRLDLLSCC